MASFNYKYVLDGYPDVEGVNVYDYTNEFDYMQWGINTVLRVLHVPWDMSYDNVVEFGSDELRDEWVKQNTIREYKLDTAINVQPDGEIKLPIPFDVMSKCNYIVVEYPVAPVNYEKSDRISTVGFFVANVMQMAPSTTKCFVQQDYWFTYIHDIEITYMDLARGHAPMSMVDADTYLKKPIDNCEYLLAPDVNYGYTLSEYTRDRTAGTRVKQIAEWVANSGQIYAVICSTGNALLEWGTVNTDTMTVPSISHDKSFGCSGFDYLAMKEQDLTLFIQKCNELRPQYLQTIQGLFFVPEKLINIIYDFRWEGFDLDLHFIETPQRNFKLTTLTKDNFGYDEKYADIAKLYTDPYAQIEVCDEYGNISVIAVESTNGTLEINTELNLIYPFLGLDIMFVNLNGEQQDITEYGYSNIRSFAHSGEWYNNIRRYNIPSFIVCQSQSDRLKFDRYFPNKQREAAYNTRYDSDTDNANTRNTNALLGAQADKDNAYRNANLYYDNTVDEAERDRCIRHSVTHVNDVRRNNQKDFNSKMLNIAAQEDNLSRAYNVSAGVITQSMGIAQSIADVTVGALTAGATAPVSIATGDIAGGISNVAGTIGSQATTMVAAGAQNTYYEEMVAIDVERSNALYGTGLDPVPDRHPDVASNLQVPRADMVFAHDPGIEYHKTEKSNGLCTYTTQTTNSQLSEERENYYNCIMGGDRWLMNEAGNIIGTIQSHVDGHFDGTAPRTKGVGLANADTTYNAAAGIANNNKALALRDRDRDKNLAISEINNGNKNQGVGAPAIYGNAMNSETAASRPLALFVNVRTQSDHAISAAGDQFCRYGYVLNKQWNPDKLQVMKHFTYWQVNDIWIKMRGESIEDASEMIKQIFMRGTTVWSDPAEVNAVSIYDNI